MNLIGINFNAESLGKIEEFHLDSLRVCNLFEKYLKTSKKTDEEDFMSAWTETVKKKENYFSKESVEKNYPHSKMIILDSNLCFDVLVKNNQRAETSSQTLSKVTIFYDLNDNQNGELSKNGFPYLGIFIAACFYNHAGEEIFKIAVCGTKNNCDLIKPIIDPEQLTIKTTEKIITFISNKDFNNTFSLFEEVISEVNDFVGSGFIV